MKEAIVIDNLSYSIGDNTILDNISLSINEGEVFSLFGSSGSGKTTLLKIISGVITPDSGKVQVYGLNPLDFNNTNRVVATVWQSRALFPHLSVKENVWYGLKFKAGSESEKGKKYREVIELLKIGYLVNRNVKGLSGGEQQKIALARALVIEPKVLLLDEPFTGIDKLYKDQLKEDLRELLAHLNCTFVFVSHDTDDIYSLSNRIAVFENRKITQIDIPPVLYNFPHSKFVADSIGNFAILTAEIVAINMDQLSASVDTEIGRFTGLYRKETSFLIGEKVNYAIKIDGLSTGKQGPMSAVAKITGKEVKGKASHLLLKLDGRVGIKLPFDNSDSPINESDEIDLSWNVKDAFILKN